MDRNKIELNLDEQMYPLSLDGKKVTPAECVIMIETVRTMRKEKMYKEQLKKNKKEM
ncbi:hypothetical protein [Paenibacillus oralis]|uniref:hypothetical protein n=1 Tax=Paenibacillus oralis TaxID=2490856 RepID=UPI0015ABD693|nr:hypothetical protein [Paenibacillus oralis]